MVQFELDLLNTAYGPANIHFNLEGIDWTTNTLWSKGVDALAMKTALRRGDYKTLNVYILGSTPYFGVFQI